MKHLSNPVIAQFKSYAGWLFVALIMGYLARVIVVNRAALTALTIRPAYLVVHIVLIGTYFALLLIAWIIVIRVISMSVLGRQAALIWLLANAGKYVPGKVLMFGGRVVLLQRAGCRISDTLMATTIEHMMLLIAALPLTLYGIGIGIHFSGYLTYTLLSLASIGALLVVICPSGFFRLVNRGLAWAQRPPLRVSVGRCTLLGLLCLYLAAWLCYGLSSVAIMHAVGLADLIPITSLIGISVSAWMLGFCAFITPGGLGVREAVFAGFLMQYVSEVEAIACALLFRLTWTVVEWVGVAGGGLAYLLFASNKAADTC